MQTPILQVTCSGCLEDRECIPCGYRYLKDQANESVWLCIKCARRYSWTLKKRQEYGWYKQREAIYTGTVTPGAEECFP